MTIYVFVQTEMNVPVGTLVVMASVSTPLDRLLAPARMGTKSVWTAAVTVRIGEDNEV